MGVQTKTIFNMTVEGESQIFEFQKSLIHQLQIGILTIDVELEKKIRSMQIEFEIFYLITIPFSKHVFY